MGIDSYLDGVREDGEHDSEGVFTLALDKAKAKLAAFRLADPRKFPQFLVSCATLSGAQKFVAEEKLRLNAGICRYTFDGEPILKDELMMLSTSVTGAELSRRLKALGVVLDTLGAFTEVRFSSGDGGTAVAVRVSGGEMHFYEIANGQRRGSTLEVTCLDSSFSPSGWTDGCRYSSMTIELNEQIVTRSFNLGVTSRNLFGVYHLVGSDSLRVRPPSVRRTDLFNHREKGSGYRTLVLGLATESHSRETEFQVVVDGVTRRMPSALEGFPLLCGIVTDSRLNYDLSGQGLLIDEAHEELTSFLTASIDDFLLKFCADEVDVPDDVRADFLRALSQRYPSGSERPVVIAEYLSRFYSNGTPRKDVVNQATVRRIPAPRSSHRRAATFAREAGSPNDVLMHLLAERTYLRSQKTRCAETEELIRCFQFLQGDSSSRFWAEDILPDESASQGSRFRALLMHLEKFSTEQTLEWLEKLEIPNSWSVWIEFELAIQDKTKDRKLAGSDIALQILPYILEWEVEGANEGFSQIKALKNRFYEPGDYKLWLDFLWRCYRGRMSLLRAERLRLALTFLWPTQTEIPGFTRDRPYPGEEVLNELVHERIDDDNFVIDLLFTLHALRSERHGDAKRFLARVLLQGSLQELYRPLKAHQELPREPFHC